MSVAEIIKKYNIGLLKSIVERGTNYASRIITLVNLALLINVSIKLNSDLMQYIPLAILGAVGFALVMFIDIKYIWAKETEFANTQMNPAFKKMAEQIDKIEKRMEAQNGT